VISVDTWQLSPIHDDAWHQDAIRMGWARNQGLRRMTNAGHVTGISEVTQGHGLDVQTDLDNALLVRTVLTLRARPGYIVYMNGEWNDVRLPEGRFSSNLYRVVGECSSRRSWR
jgi:hypothetical protein